MKILGTSGPNYDRSFIAMITEREMGYIINQDNAVRLNSGDIVEVKNSFSHLESINNQPEQRAKIATQLRSMAELIEMISPIVIPAEAPTEGGEA